MKSFFLWRQTLRKWFMSARPTRKLPEGPVWSFTTELMLGSTRSIHKIAVMCGAFLNKPCKASQRPWNTALVGPMDPCVGFMLAAFQSKIHKVICGGLLVLQKTLPTANEHWKRWMRPRQPQKQQTGRKANSSPTRVTKSEHL